MTLIFPNVEISAKRALLIDIDNTLYDYEPRNKHAQKACYLYFRNELGLASLAEYVFYDRYKHHRSVVTDKFYPKAICRSRALAFQGYLEELGVQKAPETSLFIEKIYWDTFTEQMMPCLQAVDLLQKAKEAHLKIIAVTDMTTEIQLRKLSVLGVSAYIDDVVTSEMAGIEKPSPIIFNMALDKAGCSAVEAIMVGDDLEKDIKGAEALGIKAYQVIVKND